MNGNRDAAAAAQSTPGESPTREEAVPAAPLCVGICMMDENGYCIGCGRTAEDLLACFPGEDNEPT